VNWDRFARSPPRSDLPTLVIRRPAPTTRWKSGAHCSRCRQGPAARAATCPLLFRTAAHLADVIYRPAGVFSPVSSSILATTWPTTRNFLPRERCKSGPFSNGPGGNFRCPVSKWYSTNESGATASGVFLGLVFRHLPETWAGVGNPGGPSLSEHGSATWRRMWPFDPPFHPCGRDR